MDNLLLVIIVLLVINIALAIGILMRKSAGAQFDEALNALRRDLQDGEQQLKQDLLGTLQALNGASGDAISRLGTSNVEAINSLAKSLREAQEQAARLEQEKLNASEEKIYTMQKQHMDSVSKQLALLQENQNAQISQLVQSVTTTMNAMRDSQSAEFKVFNKATNDQMTVLTARLDTLTQSNEDKLEKLRNVVSDSLVRLQKQNDAKLEDIRVTVGEKLQTTLEQRLANSFNVVNQQLESVFKGLGEMRSLASEVGGLKKVLGNVKLRGNLGEVQLGAIMEQLLAPEQYATNVATVPGSSKRVEFAVKLPGKDDNLVYLPIDSKFPADTYTKLQEAKETADRDAIKDAQKALRDRILSEAKDISEKYVKAPHTTDFAIMFLPFEGLYSEVLSLDIFNELQNKYHIMIAGPNTMAAMLNSLRMGFKTLALQKRSSEISEVLEAVKTEFGKFGDCLSKMKGHLDSTSRDLDELIGRRSRKINVKLRSFDTIELDAAEKILQISNDTLDGDVE